MVPDTLERRFEGCKLTAYDDPLVPGVWTIGFGHTGKDVWPGLVWTPEEAELHLSLDVLDASYLVLKYSPAIIGTNLEAITDFVFNLGIGNYRVSTLCKFVNALKWDMVRPELLKWCHASGHAIPGLLTRRKAEAALIVG